MFGMDVRAALVVVGEGPFDLAPVGGVPAVVRAVRAVLVVADHVTVSVPPSLRERVLRLCDGLPVRCDGPSVADVVVLHEAVRPLAPPALALAVLDAVSGGAAAAVPVLPLTDTVKQLGPDDVLRGSADRATLRVVQSPVAFRPARLGWWPRDALDLVRACAAAGEPMRTVPGDGAALALRTPWDMELAEMALESVR